MDTVAIANLDTDPNLTDQELLEVLEAMTVDTYPELLMNFVSIAKETSVEISAYLEAAITTCCALNAGAPGHLPGWVLSALQGGGIDINNAQTQAAVNAMGSGNIAGFDAPMAAAVIATGTVTEPLFRNIRLQHVTKAREKRAAGKI